MLITLQYCSGFCHTLTWIGHGFTCVPHPEPPLPPPSPSRPSGSSERQEPQSLTLRRHRRALCPRNQVTQKACPAAPTTPGLLICTGLQGDLLLIWGQVWTRHSLWAAPLHLHHQAHSQVLKCLQENLSVQKEGERWLKLTHLTI